MTIRNIISTADIYITVLMRDVMLVEIRDKK